MTMRIAIVGAGITGLTAAWRLREAGHDVTIYEKTDRIGGRTRTVRQDGFVFDVGAITMLPTCKNTVALAKELGIGQHLHKMTPVIGVPRGGQIHRLDLARPLASVLDHLKAPGRAPTGKGVMSFFVSDDWYAANADHADTEIRDDILAMARPFIGDIAGDVESFFRDYEDDIDQTDHVQVAGDFCSMGIEAAVVSGQNASARLISRFAQ